MDCVAKRYVKCEQTEPKMMIPYTIRTASAEELGEHVKRVGILMLATFVGLQALLAMPVVYLPFLFPV